MHHMRTAHQLALEAMGDQILRAIEAEQLAMYEEYEKVGCDSVSGSEHAVDPEQEDFWVAKLLPDS